MGGIGGAWDYPSPPEEPVAYAWCDRCDRWNPCPCGCGAGWCPDAGGFVEPDGTEECRGFCGEPPENVDDSRVDAAIEERIWNGRC